jgi:thioredoxin 1
MESDMAGDAANLVHLNDLNWKEEVLDSKVPVLVDFSAVWCGPCKMLSPIIHQLSDELAGKVKVGKLDIDESPATSAKYGIRGVPTVAMFVGGEVKMQKVGLMSHDVLAKLIQENLSKLTA